MAVQVGVPHYQPRMRLETPASVYFPAQNVSGGSASELLPPTAPALRPLVPTDITALLKPPIKTVTNAPSGVAGLGPMDARRMRSKSVTRQTVDYNASLINYVQVS